MVVVEHDEEIMEAADWIIDVGPKAGRLGGEIVFEGTLADLPSASESYTAKYLTGEMKIPVPGQRRKWSSYIEVCGAREHNLKNIDVKFPLGVLTVVTGVSGSGKSTLVRDVLYRALLRQLGLASDAPGAFQKLAGDVRRIGGVEFVDQNPIGKSSRSNPATYLKAYDEIRALFAAQQGAKQMGFSDAWIAAQWGMTDLERYKLRETNDLFPVYKIIDSCAAEFDSYVPYFYSTYEDENESIVTEVVCAISYRAENVVPNGAFFLG